MKWNLTIAGPAQKDFQKLPQKDQARVKVVLIAMQDDPFQAISSASKERRPDGGAEWGATGSSTTFISRSV